MVIDDYCTVQITKRINSIVPNADESKDIVRNLLTSLSAYIPPAESREVHFIVPFPLESEALTDSVSTSVIGNVITLQKQRDYAYGESHERWRVV